MGADFGADARRQRKIALVPGHVGADAGHRQGGNAVLGAGVDQLDHIADGLVLIFGADINLRRHRRNAEAQRVLDIDGDQFVGKLGQDALPGRAAQHHRLIGGRRDRGAQGAPGAHQHIGIRHQWQDIDIDTLQPGGRPLEIAVIEGQHDGAPAFRIEDTRQAVLHAPIQRPGAFQKKRLARCRNVHMKFLALLDVVFVGHASLLRFGAGSSTYPQ